MTYARFSICPGYFQNSWVMKCSKTFIISRIWYISESDWSLSTLYNHAMIVLVYPLQHIHEPKYDCASQSAINRGIMEIMMNHRDTNPRFSPKAECAGENRTRSYSRSWLCPYILLHVASADFHPWLPIVGCPLEIQSLEYPPFPTRLAWVLVSHFSFHLMWFSSSFELYVLLENGLARVLVPPGGTSCGINCM